MDISKFEDYEISEADIDKVLNYLRIVVPERATPEEAIDFLEYSRSVIHGVGHTSSDKDLEKLYEQFSKQNPKK